MDKNNILVKSATINSQVKSQLGINAYKIVKEMIQTPVDKLWSHLNQESTFCRKIINTTLDDFLQLAKVKKIYHSLWIDSIDQLVVKSAFSILQKKGTLIFPNPGEDSTHLEFTQLSKKWVYVIKN